MAGFIENARCISSNGVICFGSPMGVAYFDPYNMSETQVISQVKIVICESLSENSKNNLRLSFATENYGQLGLVEYEYRLNSSEWYSTHGSTFVTLCNIPAGNYKFEVKARLRNSNKNEYSTCAYSFSIRPSIWATWWAKLIYCLIALTIVLITTIMYLRRIKAESNLKIEEQRFKDVQYLNDERLRFFTNITHELRTPLTLILGPLEDLLRDTHLPSKYTSVIKTIHASAQRLLELINQILEFRKTETQNRQLTIEYGKLQDVISELCLRFKELNRNPELSIKTNIDKELPEFYFDKEIIITILNNLVSNAIKYTPKGYVCISLTKKDNNACLEVSDSGYGIPEDSIRNIFNRYYQVQGTHQASGTGIGLAIVKSLSDIHQAKITVKSTEGQGTTFQLLLSLDNTYPTALHKEASKKSNDSFGSDTISISDSEENASGKKIVLISEDNTEIRQYIANSLEFEYEVIQASDGQEALSESLQNIPDIIVTDIMMPGMDGIELTRALKNDIRTSHIPIIILTALGTIQNKEEGYLCGADSYLTKPFSASLLRTRIQNILKSRESLSLKWRKNEESREDISEESVSELNPLDSEFLEKITKIIEANITSGRLDMPYMIERMNMSHSTLYRKVKALTGLSPNELIRKLKLRKSLELLMTRKYSIKEAAYLSGFNNLGNFRESFKAEFGTNPTDYLLNNKQNE